MSLVNDGVPFRLVVEPQEYDAYCKEWTKPGVEILMLPFRDQGSVTPARNWIWEYSLSHGEERHWQVDDNIRHWGRRWRGKRLRCDAGIAMKACEDLTDRYENVALSGLDYYMFVPDHAKIPPMSINCHVYSNTLIKNDLPYRYRVPLNEDTDLCLQVLSGGLCTILIHAFLIQKLRTMIAKGGNTATHYGKRKAPTEGRLKMARSLERMWPGVVSVDRRFQRPQHVIKGQWKMFDTPLKPKPGYDPAQNAGEYGMQLKQVTPEIKSDYVRRLQKDWNETHGGNDE